MSETPAISVSHRLSRRGLLRVTAGLAVAGVGLQLLAACAPAAQSGGGSSGAPTSIGSTSSSSSSSKLKMPTYAPLANLPNADLPGSADGLVEPGYLKYPANLITSVPQPPGKGTPVNAITVSLSPAPTPLDQNPAQQQVNKELGVTLNIPSISTVDYPTRLSTVIAGADLPVII